MCVCRLGVIDAQLYHCDVSLFADSLEDNGIKVWVDVTGLKAGVDFLSKIGKAIIDSKVRHKHDVNMYLRNVMNV